MWFIQPNHFIGKHRRCLPLDYIPQKSTDSRYFVKSLQVVRVYTHMWTNVMWQKILFSTAVNYRDVNVVVVLKCVAVNSSDTVSYMFGVFHIHWHSWQLRHTITNSLILRRVCFNKVLDYTPNYIKIGYLSSPLNLMLFQGLVFSHIACTERPAPIRNFLDLNNENVEVHNVCKMNHMPMSFFTLLRRSLISLKIHNANLVFMRQHLMFNSLNIAFN